MVEGMRNIRDAASQHDRVSVCKNRFDVMNGSGLSITKLGAIRQRIVLMW